MIDDKSKCSHFSDENTSKNIVFITQCNSIQKILQSALSTNVTKKSFFITIERIFRKKNKFSKKKNDERTIKMSNRNCIVSSTSKNMKILFSQI